MNKKITINRIIGIFLLGTLLILAGCINGTAPNSSSNSSSSNPTQKVSLRALNTGFYDKQTIEVKAGMPVEFSFSADKDSGCGRQLLIPSFNVELVSKSGETLVAKFTPTQPGTYPYHCGMKMFNGKLIVK